MALTSFMLAGMTSSKAVLILLGTLGVGSTIWVVPLHFFRAWRRFRSVPNRHEYALWVGFETVLAFGFFLCAIWTVHN